jgi:hypothetical protein
MQGTYQFLKEEQTTRQCISKFSGIKKKDLREMRVGQFFGNTAEACYNDWNKKEKELKATSNSISETTPKASGVTSAREAKESPKKSVNASKAKLSKEESIVEPEVFKIPSAESI